MGLAANAGPCKSSATELNEVQISKKTRSEFYQRLLPSYLHISSLRISMFKKFRLMRKVPLQSVKDEARHLA